MMKSNATISLEKLDVAKEAEKKLAKKNKVQSCGRTAAEPVKGPPIINLPKTIFVFLTFALETLIVTAHPN
jgi:hypothetical protein